MSVLLRAALVIGALSYLALREGGTDRAAEAAREAAALATSVEAASAGLQAEARRAIEAEVVRRLQGTRPAQEPARRGAPETDPATPAHERFVGAARMR